MEAIAKLVRHPLSYSETLLIHTEEYLASVREACEKFDFSELFRTTRRSGSGKEEKRFTELDATLETLEENGETELASEVRSIVQNACDTLFFEGVTVEFIRHLEPSVLDECFKRAMRGEIRNSQAVFLIRLAFMIQCREAEENIAKAETEEDEKNWRNRLCGIRTYAPRGSAARSRTKSWFLGEEERKEQAAYGAFLAAKASGDVQVIRKSISLAKPWWFAQAMEAGLNFAETNPGEKESESIAYQVWQTSERESECHLRAARLIFLSKDIWDKRRFVDANLSINARKEPKLAMLMVTMGLGLAMPKDEENPDLFRLGELANYHWSLESACENCLPQAIRTRRGIIQRIGNLLEHMMENDRTSGSPENLKDAKENYGRFIQENCPRHYRQILKTIEEISSKEARVKWKTRLGLDPRFFRAYWLPWLPYFSYKIWTRLAAYERRGMTITLGGLGASIIEAPKARLQSLESELRSVVNTCDGRTKTVSERVSRVLKAFELPRFDNVAELDISIISNVFFSPFPEIALSNQQRKILFIMLFKDEMTAKEIAQHGGIPITSIFTELYRLEAKGHVVQKPEHRFAVSETVLKTVGLP